MIRRITPKNASFQWVDLQAPSRDELQAIAQEFSLHPTSVQDCLDPSHQPKLERIGDTTFLILRCFDPGCTIESDTVLELTNKLGVFVRKDLIVTVHARELRCIAPAEASLDQYRAPTDLLLGLLDGTIASYRAPLLEADDTISKLEFTLFNNETIPVAIRDIYFMRRRAFLFRRVIRLTLEIARKLSGLEGINPPMLQDVIDHCEAHHFIAEDLQEDVSNLLSTHISLSSHRTNEVMRVLTVFSVFFLPLTFIVGIYGMNFEHMPELRLAWGYPATLLLMALVTIGIFLWFRKKGWLK